MKYLTFALPEDPHTRLPGMLVGERVVSLPAAWEWAQARRPSAGPPLPHSLNELVQAGRAAWEAAAELGQWVKEALQEENSGRTELPRRYPFEQVILHPPLQPLTLRDFYAFEAHVSAANRIRGRSVPEEWYRFPVFYFTNPTTIFGPEQPVPYPVYTQAMDFELEIGCIIGAPGANIPLEKAEEYIFGYTIFNDWSARDVQRLEMKVGLGPAKGKDFASSLGPLIVTPDELQDRAAGRPGVYNLAMKARVNGQERSSGNWQDLHYSFGEMIERASQEVRLQPGEILGSGTVGTGCLLELTAAQGPWLEPGDVVELEVERLGVLRNPIVQTNKNVQEG
jgi:fumarylacetoacetate (FAA) hydrolase